MDAHVEAGLRAAVVRCLLVRFHADLVGEGGGHRIAVGLDVPHVAQRRATGAHRWRQRGRQETALRMYSWEGLRIRESSGAVTQYGPDNSGKSYTKDYGTRPQPPDLDRHGNERSEPGQRPRPRGRDRRYRFATLVTVAEAPVKVVHQPDAVLDRMDSWNKTHAQKSGLIDKVKAAKQNEAEVEAEMIAFLLQYVPAEDVADVRQFDLPGSPLPRPPDAEARSLLPLSQPRRVDAQGTGEALEARASWPA